MAKKKSNIKTRFTNTKGEKVTVFKDGTKTRTGGKPEELARLVNQADTLGIDTGEARAMLAQDAKEGYKPYKGSSYETAQKGGKRYEPTILSTVGGRDKFNANIMPEITKMNEGVANLGVEDTTTKTETTDISDKMIQDEYDASLTPEQKASNDYIDTLTKDYDTIQKAYDDLSKASARTARAETRALRQQYDERKRALEESNKAEYNQTQQAFIRGGQAEYSPTMTAGFLSAREREGQARIGELNDLYMSKVDAINVALEEKEYSNAASEVKALKEIEAEIRTEIKEQAKVAKEETQAIQDRQNIVKVAEYLKTNPTSSAVDIFAQFGGVIPFDTIKEITDAMPGTKPVTLGSADILVDPITGKIIASGSKVGGGSGEDGTGVVGIKPVGTPTVEGIGSKYENSSFEAQMLMDDIMNKIPTQLKNTEKEVALKYEQIRKQLVAGYTYQQIVDRLSGFSLQADADKPLGNTLYDMALGTDIEAGKLASMLNRGADEQAMTTVENAQLENASGFFSKTDKARATINQADTVISLLSDPTFPKDALGAFDGRKFKVERFFGISDKDREKVQKLESALQLLASPIRVEVAGTAATPSEMEKINAFQSDILDQPDTIKVQVESLRDSVLGFHNQARSQRGLPSVDKTQLVDNKKRLDLYRGLSAKQIQSYSNFDLDSEIDSKLGGDSMGPKVDANGYPL